MSVITFCAYGLDKFRVQKGLWRIPEKVLHILELCCGWPGALLAQRLLRHKSYKGSFRIVFWAMVVFNVGLLIVAMKIGLK
jgi:uncharacterized membrane protein YsdA (DUF1294 family)